MRNGRWIVVAVVLMGWMSVGIAGADEPDGKAIYKAHCAMCHGIKGVPSPGFAKLKSPDFTDKGWQDSHTDAQIQKSVGRGVSGTMMKAFQKDLSPTEITAVVKYLRTLKAAK